MTSSFGNKLYTDAIPPIPIILAIGGSTTIIEGACLAYRAVLKHFSKTARESVRHRHDQFCVDDYVFEYREDAEAVLAELKDMCDIYGWVSVASFFDMADPKGISGRNVYAINYHGWNSVEGAKVIFNGIDGYVITLPPAISHFKN